HLQDRHAAKTIADGGGASVELRMSGQDVQPGFRATAKARWIVAEGAESGHDAFAAAHDARPVHIAGENDEAPSSIGSSVGFGAVIEAAAMMNEQQARFIAGAGFVMETDAGERSFSVVVFDSLTDDWHESSLWQAGPARLRGAASTSGTSEPSL